MASHGSPGRGVSIAVQRLLPSPESALRDLCLQATPPPLFFFCRVSGIQRLPLADLSIFPISLNIPPHRSVFAGAQTPWGGTVETTAVLHQGSPVAICSCRPLPLGTWLPRPERCLSLSCFSWISQPHIRPQLFQPEACKLGHSKPLSLPGTPVSLADVPSLQQALLFSGQSRTAPHPHPLSQHLLSVHRVGCRDA